jgi:chemotaxis protein MotB
MKKKKKGPIINMGLDEWFGTYSDCITLLLCFFVLLYASSSTDTAKVQYIAQMFQTGGSFINTVVDNKPAPPDASDAGNSEIPVPPVNNGKNGGDINDLGAGEMQQAMQGLAEIVQEAIDNAEMSSSIQVEMGAEGTLRINFEGDMMFKPNSSELTDNGKRAISLVTPTLNVFSEYTKTLAVDGHTNRTVGAAVDEWDLSANRSLVVLHYLNSIAKVDEAKYELGAFAGFRPAVEDIKDPAYNGGAKNRRVELIITRNEFEPNNTYFLFDVLRYDYNQQAIVIDNDGHKIDESPKDNGEAANDIITNIDDKYGQTGEPASLPVPSPSGSGDTGSGGTLIPNDAYYATHEDGSPIVPA